MAQSVSFFSLLFAAAVGAYMAILIFRRWHSEHEEARRKGMQSAVAQYYLRCAAEGPEAEIAPPDAGFSIAARLASVSHLLQLLRGAEREALLQVADSQGLFDTALQRAQSDSAAKRSNAIRVLEQFGSERCVHRLIELMANDVNPAIRIEAAGALARVRRLPYVRDTISLLSLADTPPTPLHHAIMRSLASRDADRIVSLLDEDLPFSIRALLIDALGWSGDLRMEPHLSEASRHSHPTVRLAAFGAARQLGHPAAAEWVMTGLDDQVDEIRAQAALTCSTLGIRASIPMLQELESDRSLWVRMRAHDALAALSPARDIMD